MIHIMIATPAYDGKVELQYALSLANTVHLLKSNGVKVTLRLVKSGSLLVAERNRIIQEFWESDCTHLLCIDSDLGWPEHAVLAMLDVNKEFVGGVYPARGQNGLFLFRPVMNPDKTLVTEKHLLKMDYIPSGFILLSKSLIAKMRDKFPELYYEPKNKSVLNPEKAFCFFDTELWEGEFWGEDYVFCRRAREAGADIWVDPLIQFNHAGTIGMLIESLSKNPNKLEPIIFTGC